MRNGKERSLGLLVSPDKQTGGLGDVRMLKTPIQKDRQTAAQKDKP